MPLILEPNTSSPDDIYQLLVDMHDGLDAEASARVSARMILLLANHIGDASVVAEAARIARVDLHQGSDP